VEAGMKPDTTNLLRGLTPWTALAVSAARYGVGSAFYVVGYALDRAGLAACLPGGALLMVAAVVQGAGRRVMGEGA